MNQNRRGRPKGKPLPAEHREKIREFFRKKWQDPEYRTAQTERLRRQQAKASAASAAKGRFLPPKGTPERRLYNKISGILGAKAAHAALGLQAQR